MLCVFNKADLVEELSFTLPAVRYDSIYMSAGLDVGIEALWDLIEKKLNEGAVEVEFLIPYAKGGILNDLQERTEVLFVDYRAEGTFIRVHCREEIRDRYREFLIFPEKG